MMLSRISLIGTAHPRRLAPFATTTRSPDKDNDPASATLPFI
ncbi:hypothetical protein [Zobellella endophytica]|nr:hypothetical protein [Zobellella endophytica]